MAELDRQHIGRFRILRRLGAGGMGEVFLAHDPRLDRRVALKRVRLGAGASPEARERFRREARLAAALNHPAIVQIHELLEGEGGDTLVMEYVEGRTVAELLEHGPLGTAEAGALARDVTAGLAAAHARGLIHRDLKAENVVVTPEGQAKILDFGLAKALWSGDESVGDEETALTAQGVLVGTTRAMSPEQARGGPVDARSDLFSLGVLLYEMLSGTSPFRGANPVETLGNLLSSDPRPVGQLAPRVPAPLAGLVMGLLAKRPEERPQSAAEVLPALAEAAAGGAGTGGSPPPVSGPAAGDRRPEAVAQPPSLSGRSSGPPLAIPRRRRLPAAVAVSVLFLAAALGIAAYLASRPTRVLRVAVLVPEGARAAVGEDGGGAPDLVAAGVLVSLLSTLASLEGVEAVDPSELEGLGGNPVALARAVAADETLATTIAGQGPTRTISLRRIRRRGGTVAAAETFPVPAAPEDAVVLANGVAAALRRTFPGYPVRPGTPDLEVSAESYAAFLEVKERIDSGQVAWEPELERLEAIAEGEPRFLEAQLLAARVARDLFTDTGETAYLERAGRFARRAAALAPDDSRPAASRFRIALLAGRRDEARAALAELERLAPGTARVADARSRLAEARGDLDQAIADMEEAVERSPSWRCLHRLALLEMRDGSIAAARRHLEELLERAPGHEWGRAKLAELELLYGDLGRAEELYRELIRAQPHRSDYTNLGLAQLLQGDYADAVETFERALALAPDHRATLLNLADAKTALGLREEASRLYRRVLEQLRRRGETTALSAIETMNEAQCLARLGAAEEAVALALDTLNQHAEDAEVTYQAALVFALAGEGASARATARRALEMGVQPRWFGIPGFEVLGGAPTFAGNPPPPG